MAYVRVRGNQLAIVHGVRDQSGKVKQQILFTIYSQAEARAIAGSDPSARRFRALWKDAYPDIKLDWKKVARTIAAHASALPEHYEYAPARLQQGFRDDLCAFARQIMLTDPRATASSAELLQANAVELRWLADLILRLLKLCEQKSNDSDDSFCWRQALNGWGKDAPPEIEEQAATLYEQRDFDRADPLFRLLVECFPEYADGLNYLGSIALARFDHAAAITHFERAIELGRRRFPVRLSKQRYWSDQDTRPYMRGLRNLTLALAEIGRFDEARALCDRLEHECGDLETASWHRATIGLNTGDWESACEREGFVVDPSRSFVRAFGLFERDRQTEAAEEFLRAGLLCPRAARMLGDSKTWLAEPTGSDEVQDHNIAVDLIRALHGYRNRQSKRSKQFFQSLLRDPRVAERLDEVMILRSSRSKEAGRDGFARLRYLQSGVFAETLAREVTELPSTGARNPGLLN